MSALTFVVSISPATAVGSSDATLSTLSTWSSSGGTFSSLTPAFASGTHLYTESANAPGTSITVQSAVTQANATIQMRINGGAWSSVANWGTSTFALNTGSNAIDVLVTAQDGTTTLTYTLTVTRAAAASTDATLSAVTLSSGTLSPTFAGGTVAYSASTSSPSITLTPTVNQINATVTVNSVGVVSGAASAAIALTLGAYNYVYVQVTAQDGSTTKTYTITVTRLSTDATLQSLTLPWPATTLAPTFAAGTTAYTSSVPAATTSTTVTPAATDQANATIQVRANGGAYATVASWAASGSLALNIGANSLDVKVTAQDGTTTRTYTVTVTRPAPLSTDATLSGLGLSAGTLSPTFASGTIAYAASAAASSVTATPTANQANATIQVRVNAGAYAAVASGSASAALALNVGAYNTINVLVTAQDGSSTKTYTITVTRLSTDASLQSLTLPWPATAISPIFAIGTTSYTSGVPSSTASTTVTPAATDQTNATVQVRINGGAYATVASWSASGSLALNAGPNPIDVKVTAQDGTTALTYTVTVTRVSLAPTGVAVTAGDASASVSWAASSGATTYTVTSSPGGFTCSGASSPCTVAGLTNGTAYAFTVAATNGAGTSASSVASAAVIPYAPPSVPAVVSAVAGNGLAVISWVATSGSTSYTATSSPGGRTCTAISSPCTVTGLTNGTAYTFTVIATNGAGNSAASIASVAVTPRASNIATLSSLVLSTGNLTPTFDAATRTYSSIAGWPQSTINLTATVVQANASIQIRANAGVFQPVISGTQSQALALNWGSNSIDVLVTAQDGATTTTYVVTLTRLEPPPPPVKVLPIATSTAPVSEIVAPETANTITAQILGTTTKQLVTVIVPKDSVSERTTFNVYSYGPATMIDSGFVAVRVEAIKVADENSTRIFTKVLQIRFSTSSQEVSPAWSLDGQTWSLIPKLLNPLLPDGQSDGYFVNPDGSNSIFTRHLTIFGQLRTQAPLTLNAAQTDLTVHNVINLLVEGGSGAGGMKFISQEPSTCTVTAEGMVVALSPGTCVVSATKLAARSYLDASSMPLSISIWRSSLAFQRIRHLRKIRAHLL
jgi:hypothetical protein